jgi:enoyl-CoA hydratase/carnithine racemase
MTSEVRSAIDEDTGIARITLDRPERRNALNRALVEELKDSLALAQSDDRVRVIAIAGAGPDFCAGADLRELQEAVEAGPEASLAEAEALGDLFLLIRRLEKPVVALVHGRALAGGAGLATACDLVLASSDAMFGYPEVRLGFVPAMVMAILRRSVGEKRAFELIALGDSIDANTACAYGGSEGVPGNAELPQRERPRAVQAVAVPDRRGEFRGVDPGGGASERDRASDRRLPRGSPPVPGPIGGLNSALF